MTALIQRIKWLYTEVCRGKNEEDSHFSFINLTFHSFIIDGNDIMTERDIFSALQHNWGITGSHVLLIDRKGLSKLKHSFESSQERNKEFKSKTGVRETHEITWGENMANEKLPCSIFGISKFTDAETITRARLSKYKSLDLDLEIQETFFHQNHQDSSLNWKKETCT